MASQRGSRGQVRCSFCSSNQEQARRLFKSPHGVYICDNCIDICRQIMEEEGGQSTSQTDLDGLHIPIPKRIFEQLSQYVIGQEHAKKVLSVAVYNHYKRIGAATDFDDVELTKSNILLVGPTGCGKSHLARTLARILDVPFCIADATALTEAGYVGEDVENILLRLIQAADYDVARAERGIVFIDEVDKISRKADNPSITRDVSGEGVQQALLKIMEGTVANVPPQGGRKHPHQDFIQIDTTNVLFICGGAFEGLDRIIGGRIGSRRSIGFQTVSGSRDENDPLLLRELTAADLLKYGLIPEFVGRLPVAVSVEPLSSHDLVRILTEPKDALVRQFERILALDEVDLELTAEALQAVAKRSLSYQTGARALRTVIEEVLLEVMYEIPSRSDVAKCIVNADCVLNQAPPLLITRTDLEGEASA